VPSLRSNQDFDGVLSGSGRGKIQPCQGLVNIIASYRDQVCLDGLIAYEIKSRCTEKLEAQVGHFGVIRMLMLVLCYAERSMAAVSRYVIENHEARSATRPC
jgi:hypothetical protein